MADEHYIPTRFFKVILPVIDGQTKLRIPRAFVEKYGRELSGVVKIIDPSGGVWRVGLEKIDDSLWLHDGWEKFANDHSLSFGYFLAFEYRGNLTFSVNVFDLSATEVDYPHDNPIKEENSDDDTAEILDLLLSKLNGEGCNLLLDNLQSSSNEIESSSSMETQSQNKAVDANHSFTVVFKKKGPPKLLYVPIRISKYLGTGRIELVDCNGKKWPVSILKGQHFPSKRYLTAGWMNFVKQKNLGIGDKCVFELIENEERMLKVSTIYETRIHFE